MSNQIEIKIIAQKRATKDGKTFIAYRAVQKDGKLIDCHFRKTCGNLPESNFVIKVNRADVNINRAYQYPKLWVSAIIEIINPEQTTNSADDLPF